MLHSRAEIIADARLRWLLPLRNRTLSGNRQAVFDRRNARFGFESVLGFRERFESFLLRGFGFRFVFRGGC